jgi:hypothetical protein
LYRYITTSYAGMMAFGAYFFLYGFRRPWSSGTWEGADLIGGVEAKSYFLISQVSLCLHV